MGKILFQKAELSDLPELYSAGKKIFCDENINSEKWNPGLIADIFMDDSSIIIIALRDKKILGFATGKIEGIENRIMEIKRFGVIEKFSGTGLADDLLEAFIISARESGISSIKIKADPDIIKGFPADFNKIGFAETGTICILELII